MNLSDCLNNVFAIEVRGERALLAGGGAFNRSHCLNDSDPVATPARFAVYWLKNEANSCVGSQWFLGLFRLFERFGCGKIGGDLGGLLLRESFRMLE